MWRNGAISNGILPPHSCTCPSAIQTDGYTAEGRRRKIKHCVRIHHGIRHQEVLGKMICHMVWFALSGPSNNNYAFSAHAELLLYTTMGYAINISWHVTGWSNFRWYPHCCQPHPQTKLSAKRREKEWIRIHHGKCLVRLYCLAIYIAG